MKRLSNAESKMATPTLGIAAARRRLSSEAATENSTRMRRNLKKEAASPAKPTIQYVIVETMIVGMLRGLHVLIHARGGRLSAHAKWNDVEDGTGEEPHRARVVACRSLSQEQLSMFRKVR